MDTKTMTTAIAPCSGAMPFARVWAAAVVIGLPVLVAVANGTKQGRPPRGVPR